MSKQDYELNKALLELGDKLEVIRGLADQKETWKVVEQIERLANKIRNQEGVWDGLYDRR